MATGEPPLGHKAAGAVGVLICKLEPAESDGRINLQTSKACGDPFFSSFSSRVFLCCSHGAWKVERTWYNRGPASLGRIGLI